MPVSFSKTSLLPPISCILASLSLYFVLGLLLLFQGFKMGKAKKPQKFAVMKKTISHKALKQ